MPNTNYKSGQTLIEVAVALGVAAIVIVALVILATNSLRNAQDAIRRTESTKLASTGVEAVTFYRNVDGFSDPSVFPSTDGEINSTCVRISSTGTTLESVPKSGGDCTSVSFVSPGSGLTYSRTIEITKSTTSGGGNQYNVVSTVTWLAAGNELNEVSVPRVLTNWNE